MSCTAELLSTELETGKSRWDARRDRRFLSKCQGLAQNKNNNKNPPALLKKLFNEHERVSRPSPNTSLPRGSLSNCFPTFRAADSSARVSFPPPPSITARGFKEIAARRRREPDAYSLFGARSGGDFRAAGLANEYSDDFWGHLSIEEGISDRFTTNGRLNTTPFDESRVQAKVRAGPAA